MFKGLKGIRGAGGSKGGGSYAGDVTLKAPPDASDKGTTQVLKVVDLISEGPIESFVDSEGRNTKNIGNLKGIYLNNTPVLEKIEYNGNLSSIGGVTAESLNVLNYSQYEFEFNKGDEVQDVLAGFEDTFNEFIIQKRIFGKFQYGGDAEDGSGNDDIRQGGNFATWQTNLPAESEDIPYTHIISNANVKKIIPTIKINQLFDVVDDTAVFPAQSTFGRPTPTSVNIKIEIGFEGEEPTNSYEYDFSALIESATIFELGEISLPTSKNKNRFVRFNKVENETESILIERNVEANTVKEILESKFTYPNSALVGSVFDARSYSEPPIRNYDMRLKKVQIPSNYFPLEGGEDRRFIKDESNFSYEKELYVFKNNQFLSMKNDNSLNFNLADIDFKLRTKIPTSVTSNKKYIFDSIKENVPNVDNFSLYLENDVYYLSIKNIDAQDSVLLSGDVSSYPLNSIFDISGSIRDERCELSIFSGSSLLVSDSGSLSARHNINLKGLLVGINNDYNFDENQIPENSIISNFYFQKNQENLFFLDGRISKKENNLYQLLDLESKIECIVLEESVESVGILTDPETKNAVNGGLHLIRDKIRFDAQHFAETFESEHYSLYQFSNYPGITGRSSIPAGRGEFDVSGYLYARNWNRYEVDYWNEDDIWRQDIIHDEYYDDTGAYSLRKSHGFTAAKKKNSDTICMANNMIIRYLKDIGTNILTNNKGTPNFVELDNDQWRGSYSNFNPTINDENYLHADTYVKYTEIFDDPELNEKKIKSIVLSDYIYSEVTGVQTNQFGNPLRQLAGMAQMWGRMHPSVAVNPITDKPAIAFFRISGLADEQFFAEDRFPYLDSTNFKHAYSGALTYMECTGEDPFDLNNWLTTQFPFTDKYGTPQSALPSAGFVGDQLDYDYHSENCYISLQFDESGNPGILANGFYGKNGISNFSVFAGRSGDLYCNYLKLTGQNPTEISNWNNRQMTGLQIPSPYSLQFDENRNPVMALMWLGITDVAYVSGSGYVNDINNANFIHYTQDYFGGSSKVSTNTVLEKNPSSEKIGVLSCGALHLPINTNQDAFQVYSSLSYEEHTGSKMPFESFTGSLSSINDGLPYNVIDEKHYYALYNDPTQWGRVHFNNSGQKNGLGTETWLSGAGIGFRPASVTLAYKKDKTLGTGHYPYICYSSFDQNYDYGVNRYLRTSLVYLQPTGLNFLQTGTVFDSLTEAADDWAQVQSQLKGESKVFEDPNYPTSGLYYRGLEEKALRWYVANWTPFSQTQLGNHYEYTKMFTMNHTKFKPVYEPTTTGDTNNLMAGKNHDIYRGDWDGTFKVGWTDNPAWILHDLLVDPNYGAVKSLDEIEDINIFDLYEIGKYCDAVDNSGFFVGLSDGLGGLEPRYSCNILLNESVNTFEAINRIASSFQGVVYWQNGMINFYCDKPKEIMAEFNNSNVFDGIFEYEDINSTERFSFVEVPFLDKDDDFKLKVEYVEDEQRIRTNGIIKHSEPSRGFTSRSAARRFGRHILYSNILETEIINFSVGNNSLFLRPGDIFSVQDEIKSFDLLSTKILDIDYNNNTFSIDKSINTGIIQTTQSESVMIYCPSGQSGVKDARESLSFGQSTLNFELAEAINQRQILPFDISGFSSENGFNKIHINSNSENIDFFQFAEVNSFVSFETQDSSKKYYKVISISPSNDNLYKIQGLQYDERKFNLIESELDKSIDDPTNKNIGVPSNIISRPEAPVGFSSSIFENEMGGFNLTGQITGQPNGSELYYRISLFGPDTTYKTKTVEKDDTQMVGLNPVTDYSFYNLPLGGEYELEVTSLRNPESSKGLRKIIRASNISQINNIFFISKVFAINGSKIISTENKNVVVETDSNEVELYLEISDSKKRNYLINGQSEEYFLIDDLVQKKNNSITLNISDSDDYKIEFKNNSSVIDYRDIRIVRKANKIKNIDFDTSFSVLFDKKVSGNLFIYSNEFDDFEVNNSNLFKKIEIKNKELVIVPNSVMTEDRYYKFVFKNRVGAFYSYEPSIRVAGVNQISQELIENTEIKTIYSIRRFQGELIGPSYNIDIDPGKYIFEIIIDGSKGEEINITELGIQENLSENTHKIKKMISFDEFIKLDFSLNDVFRNYTVKIKQIKV